MIHIGKVKQTRSTVFKTLRVLPLVAQPVFPVACGDVDGWGGRDAFLVGPELFIDLEEVPWGSYMDMDKDTYFREKFN